MRRYSVFMDQLPQFSRLSLVQQFDSFRVESENFERDVHLLILGTLHAAKTYLSEELAAELAKIEKTLDKTRGGHQEYLADRHAELHWYYCDQERFVRNMAVVALASRLTHALREMARSAETFSPRKKKYGGGDKQQFQRLSIEYAERFGIDFSSNTDLIDFIEPMREVRNQIVHDGGQANPFKPLDVCSLDMSIDDMVDREFSTKYPQFVSGEGPNAEVNVSQERLEFMTGEIRRARESLRDRAAYAPTDVGGRRRQC